MGFTEGKGLPFDFRYLCCMDVKPDFFTIGAVSEGYFRNRGSRFLAFAYPAASETECKTLIVKVKEKFPDATHHCFAYCLGAKRDVYRYYDDGEPSGSAGKPIYGQILSLGLTNVLVVVVRYYGGVKLGVPGLIEAYRTAASVALASAGTVAGYDLETIAFQFDYFSMNSVMKFLRERKLEVIKSDMERNPVHMTIQFRKSDAETIRRMLMEIPGVAYTDT